MSPSLRRDPKCFPTVAQVGSRRRRLSAGGAHTKEPSRAKRSHPSLPGIDLSCLPASLREAEALRLVEQEARRPFALARGPLLRVALLRTGEREHLLALTLHHIVSDGWSMGVFAREISAAYAASCAGLPPTLPRLPIQYADFALWQRSWLAGGELERQLAYWRGHLEGAPSELDLPTDRGRPAVRGFRGGERSVRFEPELSAALAALGRREGATLFMTLFSAAAALLARWSGRQDLVLGAPVANRSSAEVENLIGLFANSLALRVPVSNESDFKALLCAVRRTALGAYAHQDVPLDKLIEDLQIARSPGRSPLFQVLVGLWKAPLEELDLSGVSARRIDLAVGAAKFDLTIRFEPDAAGLLVQAEYAADLFDRSTVARLLGHLEVLLDGVVAAPKRRLSELAPMSLPELHQLLREWNDTARPAAPDTSETPATVHEMFERQAARRGDALAVEAGALRLSWNQLSRRSSRLARELRRLGVGLESRVGLLLPRSVEQIVAILGVQKAGGAYVPLDPAAPRERIQSILAEAGISVVVTAEALRGALPEGIAAVVPAAEAEGEAAPRKPDPLPAVGPENLAYILYTSGSTGRPKGVMIEHRSVLGLLAALRETVYRGAGSELKVAMNAPLTFDASVKQWVQLLDGHSLHVVPDDARVDAGRMLKLLEEARVEVLDCTPGQLGYLLAAGLLRQPGSLRRVLVGGEELPRAEWSLLAGSERPAFWNVYGPTECTVDATAADLRSAAARPVLGRPIPGVRIHVLDPAQSPVAPGAPGELCIGGDGVARGYLGRPDHTAERFVPDPWGAAPGGRMYRTGDLARRVSDGTIEFLGRLDHQVKLNGFRIELSEIEAVLAEHPGVRAAAVLLSANELGEPQLAGFVEPRGESPPNAGDLRAHLKRRLPAYMIPAAFAGLARLPRTKNGKVDRPALLALPRQAEERAESSLPETPLEKVLAGMVTEVLGLERVGRHDNFFELGGHSMRAIELVASLREAFGIDLPLFHVFDAPTVAGLAGVLLGSPEWHETVEELAPALLELAEPVGASASGGRAGER